MKYVTMFIVVCLVASVASAERTWQVRDLWSFEDLVGIDYTTTKTADSVGVKGLWGDMGTAPTAITGYSGIGAGLATTATTKSWFGNLDSTFDAGIAGTKVSAWIKPTDSYVGGSDSEFIINRGGSFNLYLWSSTSYQGTYYPDYLVWDVIGTDWARSELAVEVYTKGLFDGNWHNVSAAYDPFNLTTTLWLDGNVLASAACNVGRVNSVDNPWIMVGSGTSGVDGLGYNGGIDEVSISTLVPEPATMTLLAFGALAMLRRRKI